MGRELHLLLNGSARRLTAEWTSRDLYEPDFVVQPATLHVEVTLGDSVEVERADLFYREGISGL
jgi:hypothetical protein